MPPPEEVYARNQQLEQEVAELRAQLAWFRQQLFGGGQGERLSQLERRQLLLRLEGLEAQAAAPATPVQRISYERTAARREPRATPAEVFANLPVQDTVVIEPPEVQADPAAFEKIGEERTFEVDVTPPQLFKREFVRPKYRRKADRTQPPVIAPAPPRPVAGGYASAGLVAWILLSKYVDHLPLFRLEKMSGRWGARLSRQTMVEWVRLAAEWLEPIWHEMLRTLRTGGYVQCDETPMRCHDPDLDRGQTTQGWMWVVSRPGGDVVFDWRLSREHDQVTSLLDDYQGLLQSDGYEAYPKFARRHTDVIWLGCWAHARRKFCDAAREAPRHVALVLRLIGYLYHCESQWDAQRVGPAARCALRQAHFGLPLRLLRRTVEHLRGRVLPQSLLGKACGYLLNHWAPLTAHLHHGESRLDNNLVENAIRPSAIGKKNWLFIGHRDAGQRSAIIYSIVVSCQRHGIDPLAYLRDVLTRLPAMKTTDDLSSLLPSNWQKKRKKSA